MRHIMRGEARGGERRGFGGGGGGVAYLSSMSPSVRVVMPSKSSASPCLD